MNPANRLNHCPGMPDDPKLPPPSDPDPDFEPADSFNRDKRER